MIHSRFDEIHSQICNQILIAFGLASVPIAAISLVSMSGRQFGQTYISAVWFPIWPLQGFAVLALWAATVFRRKLSYNMRSRFIIAFCAVMGTTGLAQFGLLSVCVILLPSAPLFAAFLQGARSALLTLFVILLSAGGVATLVFMPAASDAPLFTMTGYMTSPFMWANHMLAWSVVAASAVFTKTRLENQTQQTVTDLSEKSRALEESERQYRTIFETMVDTYYRADLDGRIVTISPSIRDMLGFDPQEVIGKLLSQWYVRPDQREAFTKELRTKGLVKNFEAQLYSKAGAPEWISTNAQPWKDVDGKLLGVEGVSRNINAHKLAEEALQRAQKMEAVGHLTGGIAHDFNNLLGVIIGNAELMTERGADDENLQEIHKAAERGAVLTRRLLTFARPRVLAEEPTDIHTVIRDIGEMLRGTLGDRIELVLDLNARTATAVLDRHGLESALLNLTINARDAMPKGGHLTIATSNALVEAGAILSKLVTSGNYVCITVRDTGAGMTEEISKNALEPFFTTKPLGTGSGLGLSMVYRFATASHGNVSIASKLGVGSSVMLLLPISHQELLATDSPTHRSTVAQQNAKILVVEDQKALRRLAVKMLKHQQYAVVEAADGNEALALLEHDPTIDLLFTDIALPGGKDGFELAHDARQVLPDIKLLLTTGYAVDSSIEDQGLVADPILYKPYSRADLLQKVAELLGERGTTGTAASE